MYANTGAQIITMDLLLLHFVYDMLLLSNNVNLISTPPKKKAEFKISFGGSRWSMLHSENDH